MTYTLDGRRKNIRRVVKTRTEGYALLKRLKRDLEQGQVSARSDEIVSFQELAEWYRRTYAVQPTYVDEHKISGLRSHRSTRYRLDILIAYFGTRSLRTFTYGQIEAYKLDRLKTRTIRGNSLTLASVNRELALLRRLFNLAVREGWIARNPFNDDEPLIQKTQEKGRARTLSLAEETRLLAVCVNERAHLRPILICALDTGLRPGPVELFSLRWSDVNLVTRTLHIQAMNTKTLKARSLPISTRLLRELKALEPYKKSETDRVFGVEQSISKAWKTACKLAGLYDLRPYDLRHTFGTRLIEAGVSEFLVAKLMGHSIPTSSPSLKQTFHYTHLTEETVRTVIAALDGIERERLRRTRKDTNKDTN